jgi:hypothetical protein
MRALALVALVAGCGRSTNPCAGQSGLCLAVEVEGGVPRLDEVDVTLQSPQGASGGRLDTHGAVTLPFQFAAILPAATAGAVAVRVAGAANGVALAYGDTDATVPPSGQRVVVVLHPLGADGGATDLVGLSIGADLARVAGEDLASSVTEGGMGDLAGGSGTDLLSSGGDLPTPEDLSCSGTLDPKLSLPDPSGQSCSVLVSNPCPVNQWCVIDGPCSFRCTGCVSCNTPGSNCSGDTECANNEACYGGKCATLCRLDTGKPCLPGYTCTAIGNDLRGLCLM